MPGSQGRPPPLRAPPMAAETVDLSSDDATAAQLNRNYAARDHVDRGNEGPSWLIALGDWTSGGELWVEDSSGDEE
ncbi:unnamed protein product, partial [Prorocentrum cordatum]